MAEKRAKTARRSSDGTRKARPTGASGKAGASATPKRAASSGARAKQPARSAPRGTGKSAAAPKKKSSRSSSPRPAVPAEANDSGVVRVVEGALEEMKAVNVKVMDVHKLTDITDTMIIASGNSDRHVRSIADRVLEHAKKAGFRAMGVEGERDGEWVLVDLQDVIVHIMLPRVREFYRLENLWDVSAARREAAEQSA